MRKRRVVALYGGSLIVAGMESCLHGTPGLDIVRIDMPMDEAEQHLKILAPDVVIFDSGDAGLRAWPNVPRLLKEIPGVLIISLNLAGDEVTVLSGQQRLVTSAEDIVEAIRMGAGRRVFGGRIHGQSGKEERRPRAPE